MTQALITLPDRVTATDRGLELQSGIPFADWLDGVAQLFAVQRVSWWMIGDALAYGEREYGEKYAQALALSAATGINVDSIRSAMWVAERVPLVRRLTTLTWSHHQAVAVLEPEEQERLLAAADQFGLTVRELRAEVQKHKERVKALEAGEEIEEDGLDEGDEPEDDLPWGEDPWETDGVDLDEMIQQLERENDQLRVTIKALQSDDKDAEIAALGDRVGKLEGRLAGALQTRAQAIEQTRYYKRRIDALKDLLGVSKVSHILPEVKALLEAKAA